MIQKTLGGERLGAGKKMKVAMHNYERSTHDLGYIWRSTMAAGTLVPFIKEIALPGDTFDINLNADVKTLPTVGPLFGSFKLQLDVFMCPIRLYNAQLHMNKLGVGMDMSKVKFPQIYLVTNNLSNLKDEPFEVQQINQSSLIAYLGIRGNRYVSTGNIASMYYNAMPYLMYWDIYKNYYANKQEEKGAYLLKQISLSITNIFVNGVDVTATKPDHVLAAGSAIKLKYTGDLLPDNVEFEIVGYGTNIRPAWAFTTIVNNAALGEMTFSGIMAQYIGATLKTSTIKVRILDATKTISVKTFNLSNIDTMRENILKQAGTSALEINKDSIEPYGTIINYNLSTYQNVSYNSQAGLALKTYQSDKFNNWLKTEWLNGATGINEITAVDVSSGKLNLDSLGLAKKVYDMLNRIAVSGGSYEDWLQAVYTHEPYRRAESPIYLGGLSKEVIFQEVVSNAGYQTGSEDQALGTLAGRGTLSQKHKGGYIVAKVDEPSYIIGIVSLTPRIDYSQGYDWDVVLKTMNDLHKPALDQIGFQDLITWKMHTAEYQTIGGEFKQFSAGKQPAWLDYMTNVNKCFGNFANPDDQMFMTLNRRYELDTSYRIKDLTTYIDPQKFNYIFADTERDAQNFWVQLGVGITARRKMSAKVMPNL